MFSFLSSLVRQESNGEDEGEDVVIFYEDNGDLVCCYFLNDSLPSINAMNVARSVLAWHGWSARERALEEQERRRAETHGGALTHTHATHGGRLLACIGRNASDERILQLRLVVKRRAADEADEDDGVVYEAREWRRAPPTEAQLAPLLDELQAVFGADDLCALASCDAARASTARAPCTRVAVSLTVPADADDVLVTEQHRCQYSSPVWRAASVFERRFDARAVELIAIEALELTAAVQIVDDASAAADDGRRRVRWRCAELDARRGSPRECTWIVRYRARNVLRSASRARVHDNYLRWRVAADACVVSAAAAAVTDAAAANAPPPPLALTVHYATLRGDADRFDVADARALPYELRFRFPSSHACAVVAAAADAAADDYRTHAQLIAADADAAPAPEDRADDLLALIDEALQEDD